MGRVLGPIVFLALVAVSFVIRDVETDQARELLQGEARGRARCVEIEALSRPILDGGNAHPGFGALLGDLPGLHLLTEASGEAISFAADDDYVYGISTRVLRGENGESRHDYILRAWPLEFGVTGDLEYVIQDGAFRAGRNKLGRSGTEVGFPPPFPAVEVDTPGAPWWTLTEPETDDASGS